MTKAVTNDRCKHFGECGGCQNQHLPYPAQLRRKHEILSALLRRSLGPDAPAVQPPLGTPSASGVPWHFRQKASFVFGSQGGRLVVGHYARGSKTIVPIDECPVHSDRANRIAFALTRALGRARVPAAGPRLDGILRHLLVRTSLDDREAVVMLVVTRNDRSLRVPIRSFVDGPEAPTGFFVNIHDRPGPFMVGRQTVHLAGRSHIREDRLGVSYLISPTAFFQTNVEAAAVLVDVVMREATEGVTPGSSLQVLDLYSGSGLFALPLAARGHRVTAVEDNRDATRDAAANRRLNGVADPSLTIVTGRVDDVTARMAKTRFDVVILDPPRGGCPPHVLDAIFSRLRPPRAVYVSCDPSALSAELPEIVRAGYDIARVQPLDMFPHTDHIETVVTLERNPGE